jgi:hypothetical protein
LIKIQRKQKLVSKLKLKLFEKEFVINKYISISQ